MNVPEPVSMIRTAWLLSLAGIIPFAWFTLELLLGIGTFGLPSLLALRSYAVAILSFMGGLYWMRALLLQGNSQLSTWLLCLSVIPALTGWLSFLLPEKDGLFLLISGFAGLLGMEYFLKQLGLVPLWFWHLRQIISGIVIALLCLARLAI